ncbi:MAG TPA: HhH-GPD-type base excision DNA repair protein [Candidatus Acidoferrales bacterium]|nr:HhH-GPD-type base excision DNA repair protein [Candidatus Acidoferrales bacterium]
MPASYPFTTNSAANRLLARSGTALLIGLCLDQQVRTEKAFAGPYELSERLGYLDARKIARLSAAKLTAVFRRPPALHRYPRMMADRVRALCAVIAKEYRNDGARVWAGAKDAAEARERLAALPGFGPGKVAAALYVLGKFGRVRLPGWQRMSSEQDSPWEFKSGKKVV